MNLVADIGNTRAKIGVFDDENLIANVAIEKDSDTKALETFLQPFGDVQQIIISSVGNKETGISSLYPDVPIIELTSKTPLPIELSYDTPATLGADRIAIAVGANNRFRNENVLVVDVGTCITFDFIGDKNEYGGGSISPGKDLRFKALNNYTEKLPLIKAEIPLAQVELQGKSTHKSILTGVMRGIFNEVLGLIRQYIEQTPDIKIVLTGGDYPYFEKGLIGSFQSKKNLIFADPYLALVGLNVILNFNANR